MEEIKSGMLDIDHFVGSRDMFTRFALPLIIVAFACNLSENAFANGKADTDNKVSLEGTLLATVLGRIPFKGYISGKHCEKASKPKMQRCLQNILDDKKALERSLKRVQNELNSEDACRSARSVEEFKEEVRRKLIPNYIVDSNDTLGLSYADVMKQITQTENHFAVLCQKHERTASGGLSR